MNIVNSIKRRMGRFLKNPYSIFWHFNYTKIQRILPDRLFLKLMFRARVGYPLNLRDPKTFNEKLQWLKLYNREPRFTRMVDKYEAKKYISQLIGEKYVVPNYGVWESFEEIDFAKLPQQFVLKTTHDCGGIVICRDKNSFNIDAARKKLALRLKQNFFWKGREWPYKDVVPRILAEELLIQDRGDAAIVDYKIMCFNGQPYCCFVCMGRDSEQGMRITYFDTNWNVQPFKQDFPLYEGTIEKPKNYEKMLEIAGILSKGVPFLRVDFYETNDQVYVGELTFFDGNGFEEFQPAEWNRKLGDLINLEDVKGRMERLKD